VPCTWDRTLLLAKVTFPPLPQLSNADGTRFIDSKEMQDWVDLFGFVKYQGGIYTRPKTVTRPSKLTNRAELRVTSFVRRTTLPLRQTGQQDSVNINQK